jgi:hypothetical protein
MAFRITNTDDTVQQIRGIPISATTGAAIRCDSTAVTNDVVFAVWCYFETDPGSDADYAIFKTYTSANTNHVSLLLKRSASGATWQLGAHFKSNSLGFPYTFPSSPIGKWFLIALTYRYRAATSTDYYYLTIHDPVANTTTLGGSGITSAAGTVPDLASVGNFRTTSDTGTTRNALGIFIPAIITTQFIVDGSVQDGATTTSLATLAGTKGLTGHVQHANCVWATNYAGGAFNSANEDARAGKTLLAGGDATGNLCTFDVNAGVFPNYHQQPRGSTIIGTITAVNPYTYGGMSYPVPTDTTVGSESSPATALTLAASGRRGPNLTKLANWIVNGTGSGQLRVGIHGNSRAQIATQYPLRLSDGTFPGRTLMNNFNDMGIIGQAGLWNDGRIVGKFSPIPTCQWTGTDALEGEYGCDCSAALPRCTNSVPTVVNPSVVLTSLVNSTLGSRFTPASRTATSVPSSAGDANNYRGNGSAVRLSPGCTYRIMIRPDAGLPVTDPLTVKLHVLNYPTSSEIAAAKKVIGAGQNNTEDSSSAVSFPTLATPPVAKSITAVSAATLTNQVSHTSYGSVTVNDGDNAFANLEAGDMMQLASSGGVTNVYNEAWIVRSVTNKGQVNCTITYEWLPRQAPVIGDQVVFMKGNQLLQTVTATFTAGEVAAGKWRGIEITASAGGDGVILWGLEFFNPSRDGIIPVTLGRNGCGAWIQAARWPRVEDSTGVSLSERLFQTLDLDVAVLATADQGTAGNNYVTSYDTLIDYFQADTPSTELVLYATGPEWSTGGEGTLDKADDGNKYDWAAVLQYAARSAGLPNTAYLFSRYTSAFGRMTAGDDTTESPTHPSCVLDVTFLGQQLRNLPAVATTWRAGRSRSRPLGSCR